MNKSLLRKKIIKIRKNKIFKNPINNFFAFEKIIKKEKVRGKIIGGYYPYNYEMDVMKILEKFENQNYIISLPKIKKNFEMDFVNWTSSEPLIINKYGIPEPISNRIIYPDIILVPLVAFDDHKNRIGYGGGFYDRYIKKIKKKKKALTIGLGYSFQKVEKISTSKHDVKLDFIITEKNN